MRALLCAALLSIGLLPACKSDAPTQIVITVDTDLTVPTELDEVKIEVTRKVGASFEPRYLSSEPLTQRGQLPFTLALTSESEGEPTVQVVVTGILGSEVRVLRRAIVGFRTGKVLRLSMNLLRACTAKWMECEDDQRTCVEDGKCVPAEMSGLPPWSGPPAMIDETMPDAAMPPLEEAGTQGPEGGMATPEGGTPAPDAGPPEGGMSMPEAGPEHDGGTDGGAPDAGPDAQVPPGPEDFAELALGQTHSCARTFGGKVYCWGSARHGERGTASTSGCTPIAGGDMHTACPTPVPVNGIDDAVQLSAGEAFSCARRANNQVLCWGNNGEGELGHGDGESTPTPERVRTPTTALANQDVLDSGRGFSCTRDATTKQLSCWGDNGFRQLADPDNANPDSGYALPAAEGLAVQSFALGTYHGCAITGARTLACWGRNHRSQLGVDFVSEDTALATPHELMFSADLEAVAAGEGVSCVLRVDGVVECWGHAAAGGLGNGSSNTGDVDCDCSEAPTQLDLATDLEGAEVQAIALGIGYGCVHVTLGGTGRVACWGKNDNGVTGQNMNGVQLWPRLLGLTGVRSVSAGPGHACAIVDAAGGESQIWCWGSNAYGQLGPTPAPAEFAFTHVPQRVMVSTD